MLSKYRVDYVVPFRKHDHATHFQTDDPVAVVEFIAELLERGCRILGIRHEGLDLSRPEFDRIIKTAAGMMASKHVCNSLGIKSDEERFRFGFAA